MQRLEFSGAVRPLYGSLGVKGLNHKEIRRVTLFPHKEVQSRTARFRNKNDESNQKDATNFVY